MKIILHIGTHKTGTTSFQYLLHSKALELMKNGIHVFRTSIHGVDKGQAPEFGLLSVRSSLIFPLRELRPELTGDLIKNKMYDHLNSELSISCNTLVASHEALSFIRSKEEVMILRNILNGHKVKIVVCQRNALDFLKSWKNQLKKMGLDTNSASSESTSYTEQDSWLVDLSKLYESFKQVFGSSNVRILNYDNVVKEKGSILPELWRACELPMDLYASSDEVRLNASENSF